jgi:chromate transporter
MSSASVPAKSFAVPRESLWGLFLRFLRFGSLAWGGPVAQIAMIRQELVDEERWVTSEHFNRALAVYQVLPGPEAHELCVYFGMLSRGRWGGVVAGLGFMLPGFLLMFALSWAYVRFGLRAEGLAAVFAAVQVAVSALIVRAIVRIASHVVLDRWLAVIAILATAAQLAGVAFGWILGVGGVAYFLWAQPGLAWLRVVTALGLAGLVGYLLYGRFGAGAPDLAGAVEFTAAAVRSDVSLAELFWSGLKAGLLTFGGAYTVIPFLQRDAVAQGAWMSNAQFLDGLALSGLLPAPLIIFATFVGYIGGGPWGAVALTIGIFLPAFAFTLTGHEALDRFVHQPRVRSFLEGVTAGVVGLISGTAIYLMWSSLTDIEAFVLFALVLGALFAFRAKMIIPAVIAAAAVWGIVHSMLSTT